MKLAYIVVAIAVVVGGLILSGVLTPEEVELTAQKLKSDVSEGVAKVTTGWEGQKSKDVGVAKQCCSLMKRIESAKRAVGQDRGQGLGVVAWDDVMKKIELKKIPRCPAGGEYKLGTLEQVVRCSVSGNQTGNIKADDHVIANF